MEFTLHKNGDRVVLKRTAGEAIVTLAETEQKFMSRLRNTKSRYELLKKFAGALTVSADGHKGRACNIISEKAGG